MQTLAYILLLGALSLFFPSRNALGDARIPEYEVLDIARAISVVQPHLSNAKYIEYAMGIYRASERFGIEPSVLIAITHQESGFRENLPEGKAGEIGICQILKHWLNNAQFKEEFGVVTQAQMKRPAKSFLFAAWILRDLKNTITSGTLPYWSFYNSKRFENRFRYFLRVNRNIAALKKRAPKVYAEAAIHGPQGRRPAAEPRPDKRVALRKLLGAGMQAAAFADIGVQD